MKISTSGGMFLGDFSIAVPKIDPIVCGVTVVHTAKTPNKRDARRAKRKIKK